MDIHRSSSGDEFILEKHELQQQCCEGKRREEKLKQYSSTRTSPPPPSSSSSTSSPSHEFSFTISLHRPSPSFAIDLSPADDIFFHGHLLPLHLISHYPYISPRSSTTSSDTAGLPIRELFDVDVKKKLPSSTSTAPSTRGSGSPVCVARVRSKPKYSFSLFRKWRRPSESIAGNHHKEEEERKKKKKARFDVGRALRRYVRVVRPLFLFRGEKEDKRVDLRWRPHSFSGNYSISRLKEWGERRRRSGDHGGQFSAPASMRTSPTNSGLLVATATMSSSNDSTMEELQSAIQAAIAHCKNSINAAN